MCAFFFSISATWVSRYFCISFWNLYSSTSSRFSSLCFWSFFWIFYFSNCYYSNESIFIFCNFSSFSFLHSPSSCFRSFDKPPLLTADEALLGLMPKLRSTLFSFYDCYSTSANRCSLNFYFESLYLWIKSFFNWVSSKYVLYFCTCSETWSISKVGQALDTSLLKAIT